MQVDPNDQQSAQFEQWVLDVGQGKDLPLNHQFTLPQHMICGLEVSDLTRANYPNIGDGCYTPCNTALELRPTLLHDPNLYPDPLLHIPSIHKP